MKKNTITTSDIERAYKRVQGLQRITAALSTVTTKRDIARIIFEEGFVLLNAESGDVLIFTDERKKQFEVLVRKGFPEEFFDVYEKTEVHTPLLMQKVVHSKKPLYIEDVSRIPPAYRTAKRYLEITHSLSAVLIPLLVKDVVIGVMEFSFRNAQSFTEENKEFMLTLATQCAQAFERVTAVENLKNSKEELEVILKHIADGITVQDNVGNLIYANQAAVRSTGYKSVKDMLKAPYMDYIHRFDIYTENGKPLDEKKLPGRRAIRGEKDSAIVVQFVDKNTHISRWVNIHSTAIKDEVGNARLVVNVMHDITREKEIEQRKDDFISMASHELKTPLTTLKVYAQILQKHFSKEESKHVLSKIDSQLDRLQSLVAELLDITRIQQGKLTLQKEEFSLQELVSDITADMQAISQHTIIVKSSSASHIFADKDRIGQVITNFISNAIKYSPDAKKVVVSIAKKKSEVVVGVRDFGVGVPYAEREKVFDRFYRTEKEEKTFPGLGLGLYISSEIIRQHGGRIWVDSQPGKGSTFSFSLPL